MATITASLALATYNPPALHGVNRIVGKYVTTAELSTSASGLLLLAKIPAQARNVQMIERHSIPSESSQVINFGVRNGKTACTSASLSALIADAAKDVVNMGKSKTVTWDDTSGERFKYVTASVVSGTTTPSLSIAFSITYDFGVDTSS